jgi:hypothetical protein
VGKKTYDREEIEEGLKLLSTQFRVLAKYEGVPCYFYFGRPIEKASYFNYKVYELERVAEAFTKRLQEIKDKCNDIFKETERISVTGNQIKARLLKYSIDKAYHLAAQFHDKLMQCQMMPIQAKPLTRLSLDDIKNFFEKMSEALNEFDRKVSTSLTYLDFILEEEKKIVLIKDIIVMKAENAKKFFKDGEELLSEASAVLSEASKVTNRYNQAVSSMLGLENTSLNIDVLNEIASKVQKNLSEITASFNSLDGRLQDLYQKSIDILEAYREDIKKFLLALKEVNIDVTMLGKAFDATISQAIQDIQALSQGKEIRITWKSILNDLEQIKQKLFEEVKNVLSQDEFNVLFIVVDASTKKEWLDKSGLVQQIVSQFSKSEDEAKKLVNALIKKQLLKEGVSLPI